MMFACILIFDVLTLWQSKKIIMKIFTVKIPLKTDGKRQEALLDWISASCLAPALKKRKEVM